MAQNQPRGLTQRGREILEHRFALAGAKHMSLRELAEKFNVSAGRIRQIERASIRHILRNYLMGDRNTTSGH